MAEKSLFSFKLLKEREHNLRKDNADLYNNP